MVCHSLLQWASFCQTSPPSPVLLGWPHMAWLSFIELHKAVVRVIRLASYLWLWLQSVCPLMPSLSAYHLTWVSLTLDMGYLFTAAPAKCSHCSFSWTRGISSWTPLLTLNGSSYSRPSSPVQPPLLGCGVVPLSHCPWPRMWGSSSQPCFCTVQLAPLAVYNLL